MKKYVTPEALELVLAKEDILNTSVLYLFEITGEDSSKNFGEFHYYMK